MKWGLAVLAVCVSVSLTACSVLRRGQCSVPPAAKGKCVAKAKCDSLGRVVDVDTEGPCVKGVANESNLSINGQPLTDNKCSITYGTATSTCYGPPIPNPPVCICTKSPCP